MCRLEYETLEEDCEELSKMTDVCCLQEVRQRGNDSVMLGMEGRRYKFWRSRNGVCGVGHMVKELCKKVMEIRKGE